MEVAAPAAWQIRFAEQQRQIMIEPHRDVAAIERRDPVAATMAMSTHFVASTGDLLKPGARNA